MPLPKYKVQTKVNDEWVTIANFKVDDFDYGDPMRALAEHATRPIRITETYGE